jgi:exopolysaccharide production protein ExoZ
MICNIQYLRFFAAGMVLLHHAAAANGQIQFPTGAVGVDIFFVISGFIMVFITEKKRRSPLDFFRHRLARVVPPYWFVTLAMASGLLLVPHVFGSSVFSLPHVLSSLFFWPYPSPATLEITPLYGPGWTLNYEFFFYSLFAVALAINGTRRAVMVSIVLLTIVTAGTIWPAGSVAYAYYTAPILLEFIYGMMIGFIVSRGILASSRMSGTLIAAGVVLLIAATFYWPVGRLSGDRFIIWGLPAALIVAGSIFLELSAGRIKVRLLLIMGDASYAIYVTHFIVVASFVKTWKLVGLPQGWALVLTSFTVATAVGVAFHFVIEKPLVSFFSPGRKFVTAGHPEPASRM